ncbi:MAG TPA: NUDIX hydrolase [Candidatus Kapabacteria bacterium]|nr:NUDIX hydrolase [Candidatus Kapabacteria bacterium]
MKQSPRKRKNAIIPHWTTTTKKIVAENPFLQLEEHRREEEGTGRHGYFFIVNAPDWVNIVAITDEQEVVLIEQFRHGSERIELEIPSGIIDEFEDPADAALRELLEETGYERSDRSEFKKIGEVVPNPAFIRNKCYTYVLTHVRPTGLTQFDENENIRVRLIPRAEIEHLITTGEIQHSLIIAAFYWLQLSGY